MIKFRFIVILFLGMVINCYSQKIVAVCFADTDDEKIGNGCAIDLNNFRGFYRRLGKVLSMEVKEYQYSNDDFNVENFDSLITKLQGKTSDQDIILFYNTCHGARGINELDTKYPQLRFNNYYRSVYTKHSLLLKLPHKNLLTITDACNVVRNIREKERQINAKFYSPLPLSKEISKEEIQNTKKIFANSFELIITSSEPGLTSVTTKEGGSIFTNCFFSSFYYYTKQKDPNIVTIKNILIETQKQTFAESKRIYVNNRVKEYGENRAHTPCYDLVFKGADFDSLFENVSDSISEKFWLNFNITELSYVQKLKYNTPNDYKVVIQIDNSLNQIEEIKSVKYFFHDTFKRPIVSPTDAENDYQYTIFIWGEFLVKAEITLKDNRKIYISKSVNFDESH